MAYFAQYYIRYKHNFAPHDWELRQQHLSSLFESDNSVEFSLGEGNDKKVYKHRVYHLKTSPQITVMRFANDIDIPVERDFEPAMAKDEPSCFVIIDNRANLRTIAIQKRKKAFGNTRQVAKIISSVIDEQLFRDYCYGFEILPDYYPVDLFTVWERQQANAQSLRFGVPDMDRDEILKMVEDLKLKQREYYDDSLMGALLDILYAQKQAKYKGRYTVMPEDKKTALFVDKDSTFMRNLLTFSEAIGEPVEIVTKDGGTFRCFIENDEDISDKIVSHEFDDGYLEMLFKTKKKDGSNVEPEDQLNAEEEVVGLMNSMKHEVKEEEELAA